MHPTNQSTDIHLIHELDESQAFKVTSLTEIFSWQGICCCLGGGPQSDRVERWGHSDSKVDPRE